MLSKLTVFARDRFAALHWPSFCDVLLLCAALLTIPNPSLGFVSDPSSDEPSLSELAFEPCAGSDDDMGHIRQRGQTLCLDLLGRFRASRVKQHHVYGQSANMV